MRKSQRQAIYEIIVEILRELGIKHVDGNCLMTDLSSFKLNELRRRSEERIQKEMMEGTFPVSDPEKAKDHSWRVEYARKILSERLRKDRRLNGDKKHHTKSDEFKTEYVTIKATELLNFVKALSGKPDMPIPGKRHYGKRSNY